MGLGLDSYTRQSMAMRNAYIDWLTDMRAGGAEECRPVDELATRIEVRCARLGVPLDQFTSADAEARSLVYEGEAAGVIRLVGKDLVALTARGRGE